MCPPARRAEQHFAKLVSQLGSSLYFDRFLSGGFRELPYSLRRHLPYLRSWHGVSALKQHVRDLTGLPNLPIMLASRSTVWMELAANCLFTKCKHVLATDLEWPPYLAILKRAANELDGRLTVCRIHGLHPQLTKQKLIGAITRAYREGSCDGLFLSAVNYQGIRTPLSEIISQSVGGNRPRFVVIDGAQALGHTPVDLSNADFDLLITGSQKWLRGNLPLGMAVCCRQESADFIADMATHSNRIRDPLFVFTQELDSSRYSRFGETAIVTPLFTTNAALIHSLVHGKRQTPAWETRLDNRRRIINSLPESWRLQSPNGSLTSCAIILQSSSPSVRKAAPSLLRAAFSAGGATVTAYHHGAIRVSLPDRLMSASQIDRFEDVLRIVS